MIVFLRTLIFGNKMLPDFQDDKRNALDLDINVIPIWNQGITGKGVVVSILDDGRSLKITSFDVILVVHLSIPEFLNRGVARISPKRGLHLKSL